MPDSGDRLIWVDLETTCLNPIEPGAKILEIACVITDDENLDDKLWGDSWVVQHDHIDLKHMNATVVQMHSESGLFQDLLGDTTPWTEIEIDLVRAVNGACDAEKKPLLAGNSVQFDRLWLSAFAPEVASLLHYRNLDVSTIYEMLLRSQHREAAIRTKEEEPVMHRAWDDVNKSIQMYDVFRDLLGLEG